MPRPSTTAASYVPNAYFSFPFVATYFANPNHCSAAVSQCSANYAACTAQLGGGGQGGGGGGGGYAVTIVVPGGGGTTVTAAAGASVGPASATSICKRSACLLVIQIPVCLLRFADAAISATGSSLSSQASCARLQPNLCTLTDTSAVGFYFGTENAAARPTMAPCAGMVGIVAAGVAGLGIF